MYCNVPVGTTTSMLTLRVSLQVNMSFRIASYIFMRSLDLYPWQHIIIPWVFQKEVATKREV